MDALYVDGIEDILAIPTGPSACNDEPLEKDRPDGTVVKASVLGEELDAGECKLLAAIMEVRHLSPGERLVTEGDVDNRLVLVAAGKVAVLSNVDGREIGVYTMTRGECAGTRAFIDGDDTFSAIHVDEVCMPLAHVRELRLGVGQISSLEPKFLLKFSGASDKLHG
jgi:CRP-like cAMP-binding protein